MDELAFDFTDAPGNEVAAVAEPTFSVGELAEAVNDQLRQGFASGVWVRGEISGYKESRGHAYFTLVEQVDGKKAVINVSLFAFAARRLVPLLKQHRIELANGLLVRLHGTLDFYAPFGRLGIKMDSVDPAFTVGELSLARDAVIAQLVTDGLFDRNRATTLSVAPVRVGVVTSVGTAAWHDFHDELDASGVGFQLAVCNTRVQGDGAEHGITAAIRTLGARGDLDCVVIIRGGGSRTDLATFDHPQIAQEIAHCPIPVLTGIGHEIDTSIADLVAYEAHKTPTACAVALVARANAFRDHTETAWEQITLAAKRHLTTANTRLTSHALHISRHTNTGVERANERLSGRQQRLVSAARRVLVSADATVDTAATRLERRGPQLIVDAERVVDGIAARVALLDPAKLLARGWTITRTQDGRVLTSLSAVAPGDVLVTELADGTVTSRIEEV